MTNTRRQLMAARDRALTNGDLATFQALTRQIADLPLRGVRSLTARDVTRYATSRTPTGK